MPYSIWRGPPSRRNVGVWRSAAAMCLCNTHPYCYWRTGAGRERVWDLHCREHYYRLQPRENLYTLSLFCLVSDEEQAFSVRDAAAAYGMHSGLTGSGAGPAARGGCAGRRRGRWPFNAAIQSRPMDCSAQVIYRFPLDAYGVLYGGGGGPPLPHRTWGPSVSGVCARACLLVCSRARVL